MKKISLSLSTPQQLNSDTLDFLAKKFCGTRLTLEDDGTPTMSPQIECEPSTTTVNGCYSDSKSAVEEKFNTTINNTGTTFQRILDPAVKNVILGKVSHEYPNDITVDECLSVKSIQGWFYGVECQFLDLSKFGITDLPSRGYNVVSFLAKTIVLPSSVKSIGYNALGSYGVNNTSVKSVFILGGTVGLYIDLHFITNFNVCKIVDIPSRWNIGSNSAYNFNNITSKLLNCVCRVVKPTSISSNHSNAFANLFVLPYSVDRYKSLSGWSVYSLITYPIGSTEWQSTMQSLATEEGKSFPDYSLRYIDYDIYGVDYPTNELNGFTFDIPSEYLGTDGETFVFDTANLIIGYDPDQTRMEYYTFARLDSNSNVQIADGSRYHKVLTISPSTDINNNTTIQIKATSTQVEGVSTSKSIKVAYPVVSAISLVENNQFVVPTLTANTNNSKYRGLTYQGDDNIGVSNNGWFYTKQNDTTAQGTITVSGEYGAQSTINVSLDSTSKQRQYFEDEEVEKVLAAKMTHTTGNVIAKDDFESLTSIGAWFNGNSNIKYFNELGNTKCKSFSQTFSSCSNLIECTIPNTVTSLDIWVFLRCSNLKVINLPNTIISCGDSCMRFCGKLETINYDGSVEQFRSISFATNCFQSSSSLINVVCSDGTIQIVNGVLQ